jgi:hypothetical protein
MKQTIFIKEAVSLADYLINLTKNNNLPLEYTNLKKNNNFGNVMVDDFGDYLPFVEWLGQTTNNKYSEWVKQKAFFTIQNFQMPNGLLCTSFKKKNKIPKKNNLKIFNADKMSDSILGVNLMYDLTKKESYEKTLTRFFTALDKKMTSKKGIIYYKKTPFFKYPFSMGKYCGLYIEELVKFYEVTKDEHLLKLAEKLSRPWIEDTFFKKQGLIPFKCTFALIKPFAQVLFKKLTSFSFETSMLTKSNTNMIFGLARLQNIINSDKINHALNQWVNAVESKLLTKENVLLSIWQEHNKFNISYLGADHAAIDALLEIYLVNKNKKALNLAIKITGGWLKFQSKIGLVTETPYEYNLSKLSKIMKNYSMSRTDISRLDSQVDFAVVILKVYELTKDKKYLDAAKNITNGIIKYHKFNKGFIEFVNIKTKEQKGHKIETKFLFLILKLLILMHNIENGKKIYKDKLIKDLIRDR